MQNTKLKNIMEILRYLKQTSSEQMTLSLVVSKIIEFIFVTIICFKCQFFHSNSFIQSIKDIKKIVLVNYTY